MDGMDKKKNLPGSCAGAPQVEKAELLRAFSSLKKKKNLRHFYHLIGFFLKMGGGVCKLL